MKIFPSLSRLFACRLNLRCQGHKQGKSESIRRSGEASLIDLRAFHRQFAGRAIPIRRPTTEPLSSIATTHHQSLAIHLNPSQKGNERVA